jgi:hypothetical protein
MYGREKPSNRSGIQPAPFYSGQITILVGSLTSLFSSLLSLCCAPAYPQSAVGNITVKEQPVKDNFP